MLPRLPTIRGLQERKMLTQIPGLGLIRPKSTSNKSSWTRQLRLKQLDSGNNVSESILSFISMMELMKGNRKILFEVVVAYVANIKIKFL